jgi:K+-transporting ATPase ATPase C chain
MIAIRTLLLTTLVLGIAYPMLVTALAQTAFPATARGSLVVRHRVVVGSAVLGQEFTGPRYFHARPSAAGSGYDAMSSGGSNLGPTSRKLIDTVAARVATVTAEDDIAAGKVPVDLVTASASGLDPDITPAAAGAQAARVARARGISLESVQRAIERATTGRDLGFLGEPRVNVLKLNLSLDDAK